MAKRNKVHVSPSAGNWKVQVEGQTTPLATYTKKDDAVEHGRRWAKAN